MRGCRPLTILLFVLALAGCGSDGPGTIGGGTLTPLDGEGGSGRDARSDALPPDAGGGEADGALSDAAFDDGAGPRHDAGPDAPGADDGDAAPRADAGLPPDVPEPPPAGSIRIATWNVHFFWDDVCDSEDCGPGAFEEELSPAEFEVRANAVAAAVRGLDADIVLLQEVESERALAAVLERLYPEYAAARLGEIGFAASVDVAVLVRDELRGVATHRGQPIVLPSGETTWFAREFLEAHVRVRDTRVIVFAAHFRSQHDDDPERRLAEAQAAHDIVAAAAAAHPDALVVMGGDLNDVPGSPTLRALEDSGALQRVAAELSDEDAGTYWFDGPQALDHLLVATGAAGGYVAGTVEVVTDEPLWLEYGGSDHAALRAEFLLPGRREAWATLYDLRRAPGGADPVEVVGVVTATTADSFALQVPDALQDPALGAGWSGIYVHADWRPVPARGAWVSVRGTPGDWFGQAQLDDLLDLTVLAPWVPEPTPVAVASADVAAGGALADRYNAVVVEVPDGHVTAVQPPPSPGDEAPTNEFVLDEVLRVDDFHWLATPLPAVGARVAVTGVLRWRHDEPKLLPRGAGDVRPVP